MLTEYSLAAIAACWRYMIRDGSIRTGWVYGQTANTVHVQNVQGGGEGGIDFKESASTPRTNVGISELPN